MTASIDGLVAAIRAGIGHLHGDTLTGALILLALHLVAAQLLSAAVVRVIHVVLSYDKGARVDRLAAAFAAQLARVFVWLVVLTAYAHLVPALDRLATAMLAGVSIASVVFGLAAQSTLANLIAGVSLVFYKPFRMGDRLQLTTPTGVETGAVDHMSLGYTTLRTGDGRRVVISNSTILNQVMLNLGSAESPARLVLPFTIKPAGDIERARALVTDAARGNAEVAEVESCTVTSLASDGTGMALTVWARDAATAEQAASDLLEAVRGTLMANGLDPASG